MTPADLSHIDEGWRLGAGCVVLEKAGVKWA